MSFCSGAHRIATDQRGTAGPMTHSYPSYPQASYPQGCRSRHRVSVATPGGCRWRHPNHPLTKPLEIEKKLTLSRARELEGQGLLWITFRFRLVGMSR